MITATLLLAASTAHAECRLEALEAAERIRTSGPFHFETIIRSEYREQKIRGRAIPSEEALEIRYLSGAYDDHLVELYKDGRHWTRDAFGWFGGDEGKPRSALSTILPSGSLTAPFAYLSHLGLIPPFTEQIECPGTIEVDGRELTVYRVRNDYSLYVDPKTNLVFKYHKVRNDSQPEEAVTTYRFDAAINIQVPNVDLAERKRRSLQAYAEAKKHSDPVCRNEVIRAFERGLKSGPFHFENWEYGSFHAIQTKGSLIPSQAAHVTTNNVELVGSTTEAIVLDGKTWWRRSNSQWKTIQDHDTYQMNMKMVMTLFEPDVDEVVFTRCTSTLSIDNKPHRIYEFLVYGERDQAYKPVESRRIFIDRQTALPSKSEILTYFGKWMPTENRVYDPEIEILPPE